MARSNHYIDRELPLAFNVDLIQKYALMKEEPIQKYALMKDPIQKNALMKKPIQKYALKKDPTQKSALMKEPIAKSALMKEPIQNYALMKEPIQNYALMKEDSIQKYALMKDPIQKYALMKEPIQKYALMKEPILMGELSHKRFDQDISRCFRTNAINTFLKGNASTKKPELPFQHYLFGGKAMAILEESNILESILANLPHFNSFQVYENNKMQNVDISEEKKDWKIEQNLHLGIPSLWKYGVKRPILVNQNPMLIPTSGWNSTMQNGPVQPEKNNKLEAKKFCCSFCRANNEDSSVYTSHNLRSADKSKIVVCPILRKFVCKLCGGTGDNAHTITYCPLRTGGNGEKPLSMFQQIKKSHRVASGKFRKTFSNTA